MHKTDSTEHGSLLSKIIRGIQDELYMIKANSQPRPDNWYK